MLESLFFNHSARERGVRICSLSRRPLTYPHLHLDQVQHDDSLPLMLLVCHYASFRLKMSLK